MQLMLCYIVLTVLVDAGSRYEVEYTSGISHFLQRLAFQVNSLLRGYWEL